MKTILSIVAIQLLITITQSQTATQGEICLGMCQQDNNCLQDTPCDQAGGMGVTSQASFQTTCPQMMTHFNDQGDNNVTVRQFSDVFSNCFADIASSLTDSTPEKTTALCISGCFANNDIELRNFMKNKKEEEKVDDSSQVIKYGLVLMFVLQMIL